MDQQINDFIQGLISSCLNNPSLGYLSNEQKTNLSGNLEAHLYKLSVETLINSLNEDQINQIKDLDFESPEMETKLELFAAEIPGFSVVLEDKLQQEVNNFIANPATLMSLTSTNPNNPDS